MPLYSVAITKETNWRGSPQEFSNVYTYSFTSLNATTAGVLADALKDAEKPVHASSVLFKNARVWGPLGDPATSDTILLKDWTGQVGTLSDSSNMDREACWTVRFGTNRQDSRSRKVYLRKWLHSCSYSTEAATVLSGTTKLAGAMKTALNTYGNAILDPIPGTIAGQLASPSGALNDGTVKVMDYVEHHEFT